ncbi:MAG: TolC family protein [Prolixibacteraceae bacterium]|nr:TolC family protein [Prolixibacteraceae bacterium]
MKRINLVVIGSLLFLLYPFFGFSQTKSIDLLQCKALAKENFPKLKQSEILTSISELKNQNTKNAYLPSIELKGQATYQSEVIEIDIPVPGFNFDPVSKDQYKIYFDFKQIIWDGGVTKSLQEIENALLQTNVQKLQVELWQVYSMVEALYFSALMVDNSFAVIDAQTTVLDAQIKKLKAAVKFGAAREQDKLKLEVERISIDQKKIELVSSRNSIIERLSVLIGTELDESILIENIARPELNSTDNIRPELKLFDLQNVQLEKSDDLLSAARMPKLFGFGQAGYGKPGFNMLKNEFDPYYIVGVGLSWKVTDWNKTKRTRDINKHQQEIIATMQNDFLQKQDLQLAEMKVKVEGLERLIESDKLILVGRNKIVENAASELENGSITSTDYLIDLNAETLAKINNELHKIQLIQAIVKYNSILGN